MADPIDTHSLMTALRAELDMLLWALDEHVVGCHIARLPFYESGAVPDLIEPTFPDNATAPGEVKSALRSLSRPNYQPPGTVMRAPGIAFVNTDLSTPVQAINRRKTELQTHIETLHPNARTRNYYCRRELPGRVMLQVYRKITHVSKPVERITFTWSPFGVSTKRLKRTEAYERLTSRLNTSNDTNVNQALEIAIEQVGNSPVETEFQIRKPRAPYPIAHLYHGIGDYTQVGASIPILVHGAPVEIRPLKPYNIKARNDTRSDKHKVELVFAPLHLYVKRQ